MCKKTFCEFCRDDATFTSHAATLLGTIKGNGYSYAGRRAYCDICGREVFVPEIMDGNLEALYNEYRKQNGLIALHQLREIPEKYQIGKKPLSVLLGWEEQTFPRYFDGDVPSKACSDMLKRIRTEPAYYGELLEAGRHRLTRAAYQMSRRAVDALLQTVV